MTKATPRTIILIAFGVLIRYQSCRPKCFNDLLQAVYPVNHTDPLHTSMTLWSCDVALEQLADKSMRDASQQRRSNTQLNLSVR